MRLYDFDSFDPKENEAIEPARVVLGPWPRAEYLRDVKLIKITSGLHRNG